MYEEDIISDISLRVFTHDKFGVTFDLIFLAAIDYSIGLSLIFVDQNLNFSIFLQNLTHLVRLPFLKQRYISVMAAYLMTFLPNISFHIIALVKVIILFIPHPSN